MQNFFRQIIFVSVLLLISIGLSGQTEDYLSLSHTSDLKFEELVELAEAHFDTVGTGKGVGYKQFKRWEYWSSRNLDANGRIISEGSAFKATQKIRNQSSESNKSVTGSFQELGPMSATNTSTWSSHIGRVTAIGLDPNSTNNILVGAPAGGIWKSTNGGSNWESLFDDLTYLSIYALEISHDNNQHYFAGISSQGIWKSIDGGANWVQTAGVSGGDRVNKIIMHPTNANILFATTEFFGRIYKSTNGGDNWTVKEDQSRMYDIEFKPNDPTVMYAAGLGLVHRSTDNGENWNTISGPWVSGEALMLGVTADDNEYVYALQEQGGGFGGLYLSTNGGDSFVTQSDDSCNCSNIMGYNQDESGGQAPRDMDVIVSPQDKTEVHVAGVETWRSYDSGVNWTQTTDWTVGGTDPPFIHADVDLLIYQGTRIYAGTDGGIFYSDDEGESWTDITQGLGIRQFYRIGVSATDLDRVSGGSQDNGTGVVRNGQWYDYMGADGMETFIDWSNEDIMYGSTQFGGLYKSSDGGDDTSYPSQTPGDGAWVTPLEQDPLFANTLYQAKNEVHKSTNGGDSWTPISDFTDSGSIRELKIAPNNNQVIYTCFNTTLYKSTNGGTSWTNITPPQSFSGINYITIHPTDANRVALALSGGVKMLESLDGGTVWTDISFDIPGIGIECILYENDEQDAIYVGTNPGLYYKDNVVADHWIYIADDLPNVSVTELEIQNGFLYASTYGRGLWKIGLSEVSGNFDCASAVSIANCGAYNSLAVDQGTGANNGDATHSVWYKFIPQQDGIISIGSCNAGVNTRLWIYQGSCESLTLLADSDDDCESSAGGLLQASLIENISITAGIPIYLEWDDKWSSDPISFEISIESNYTCESADEVIDNGTYVVPQLNLCGGGGTANNSNATNSAFYSFTPLLDGTISVLSCGYEEDTRLWIYNGSCANLNQIGASDDACAMSPGSNNYASQVLNLNVTAGNTIYIEWDDRWSSNSFSFDFEFLEEQSNCPPNYTIANGNELNGVIDIDTTYSTDGAIQSLQVINFPGDIGYSATEYINLLSGFEMNRGTLLEVNLGGCPDPLDSDDIDEKN